MEVINTLGKLLPENHEQHRDAVHIAVMPVVAGEDLRPGEKIRLMFGTTDVALSGEYNDDYIGIVDPFLAGIGSQECRAKSFWDVLPETSGTITGLRHEWTHPIVDGKQKAISESELWLRQFADKWNFDYDEMVAGALSKEFGYVAARGIDLHSAGELAPGDEILFWQHIETLTGKKLDEGHKKAFCWSCSC